MAIDGSVNKQKPSKAPVSDAEARERIGRRVVYFALSVIGFLGVAAMVSASIPGSENKERFALIKDILAILLPVLGTWVGTVLAFYFSKENFDTAAKQTSELVKQLSLDQKLQEISVRDVMISMTSPDTLRFVLDKNENEIVLKTEILEERFIKSDKNRLPFVDSEGRMKYIVHRSMIDKFIAAQALTSGTEGLCTLSFQDFLDYDKNKQITINFGVLSQDAKLNSVKMLIDGNPDCSDVFVTDDGTKNGKAIGWITNVALAEKCRA